MELGVYLKEKIADWVAARRRHNLLLLSDMTGIGYSTVRRIASGETINLQTFMQLAGVILTPDETRQVIAKYFPETRHSLERSFKFYNPEKDPIQSANALLIVALCCPDKGIEFDRLISMVGTVNAHLVGQLISSELISLKDGKLFLSSSYYFSPDPTRVIRWIKYAADLFDFDNADKEGQFSCFRIEGLNESGLQDVRTLFIQTEKALEEILKDSSKRGEYSLSMALFTTLNGK